jgi:hypothetical protein
MFQLTFQLFKLTRLFYEFWTAQLCYDISNMGIAPCYVNINFAMAVCLVYIVNLSRRYSAWTIQLHGERHEFAFCHVTFCSVSLHCFPLFARKPDNAERALKAEVQRRPSCIFEWKQKFSTSLLQLTVKNVFFFLLFNIGLLRLLPREINVYFCHIFESICIIRNVLKLCLPGDCI